MHYKKTTSKMEKIAFVTGGSGFIGTYLTRQLLKDNYKVIVFDLRFSNSFINEFEDSVVRIVGDLQSEELINALLQYQPSHVFHLAGLKNRTNSPEEFMSSIEVNYKGTLNLFSALVDQKWLEHLVTMGTSEEYGSAQPPFSEETREMPNSAYGLSKLSATRLALLYHTQFNLPVTSLRPSIAYGPNQGSEVFIPALIKTLRSGDKFSMTSGDQLRDFIYIDDLINAIILAAENEKVIGKILNIAYGKSEKLSDVAKYIARELNKEENLLLGAIPYRKFEIMNYSVTIAKARTLLNWEPKISIYEGVKKMI